MKTLICALICGLSISGPVRAEVPRIPEVDALEVQAIVDNYYDCFQKEEKCAKRVLFVHGHTFDDIRLQAEMGLAYVITATVGNKKHMLLFDFGLSPSVYQNNLQRLNVDASKAEALLLSHAHQDHYGGMSVALTASKAPFYVGGEDAFAHRVAITPANTIDMDTLDRVAVEKGRKLIIATQPLLVAGVGLTTGQIPRLTDFEKVPPIFKMERDKANVPDPIAHEQALVFRVKGKGLVIITACAHAGVINTVEQARKITGENRILAVIGGMHLTSALDDVIDRTIAALAAFNPMFVAPMHCTGNRAFVKLATRLPDAYVHPSVGTRYVFEAGESGGVK